MKSRICHESSANDWYRITYESGMEFVWKKLLRDFTLLISSIQMGMCALCICNFVYTRSWTAKGTQQITAFVVCLMCVQYCANTLKVSFNFEFQPFYYDVSRTASTIKARIIPHTSFISLSLSLSVCTFLLCVSNMLNWCNPNSRFALDIASFGLSWSSIE